MEINTKVNLSTEEWKAKERKPLLTEVNMKVYGKIIYNMVQANFIVLRLVKQKQENIEKANNGPGTKMAKKEKMLQIRFQCSLERQLPRKKVGQDEN